MSKFICDVIVITWNRYDILRPCIESIIHKTSIPIRLIIIDNGSDEETLEYAKNLHDREKMSFEFIRNDHNKGFAGAVNQGLEMSTAPYVCICNNDTIMTSGWLEEMIDIMSKDEAIGIVNPQSSTFGKNPASLSRIDDFSRTYIATNRGHYVEAGQCIGFCMLIARSVIDNIGMFSEDMKTAFFEDTDFCRRATEKGYKCVVALGAYVFHHEHKSVNRHNEKEKLFAENRKRMEAKWGKSQRILITSSSDFRKSLGNVATKTEDAIEVSREDNYVYLYQKGYFCHNIDEYYDRLGLIRYLNVQIFFAHPLVFNIAVFLRILFRTRKKYFDYAFIDNQSLKKFVDLFYFVHRIKTYHYKKLEDCEKAWKRRYRSQLSL